jgi:hypothetical protein
VKRLSQWIVAAAALCAVLAAQADDLPFKRIQAPQQMGAKAEQIEREALPLKPAAVKPPADPQLAGAIVPAAQVAPPPVVERWTVEVSDGSMSRALKRWGERAGIPLVWEAPQDKPAFFAVYRGTFEEAVTQAMKETRQTNYRLHACGHDNIVRILHAAQRCLY